MERTLRVLPLVNLALCAWLVVSGVFLFFFYRPTAAAAWQDFSALEQDVTVGLVVRSSHRLATPLLLIGLSAWGLLLAVASDFRRSGALAGAVFLAVGGLVTGLFLPWDQLALWAVTAGTDMVGYVPIVGGDEVRFVLTNGVVISRNMIVALLVAHFLFGLLLTATVVLVGRKSTEGPPEQRLRTETQLSA